MIDRSHIYPGCTFSHRDARDTAVLVVHTCDGGPRVTATNAAGKHLRTMDARGLRPAATKPDGSPYSSGYAPDS
jgi:hypothetical protein